jgi:hypothetical protein
MEAEGLFVIVALILFFVGAIARESVDQARKDKVTELKAMGGEAILAISRYRFSTFLPNLAMSLSPAFIGFAILAHGSSIGIGLLFTLGGAALTALCIVRRRKLYI